MLIDTYPCEDYNISYFKRPSELKISCKNSYWAICFITQVRYGVPCMYLKHIRAHTHVHAHAHKHASLCEKTLPSILSLWTNCQNNPQIVDNIILKSW